MEGTHPSKRTFPRSNNYLSHLPPQTSGGVLQKQNKKDAHTKNNCFVQVVTRFASFVVCVSHATVPPRCHTYVSIHFLREGAPRPAASAGRLPCLHTPKAQKPQARGNGARRRRILLFRRRLPGPNQFSLQKPHTSVFWEKKKKKKIKRNGTLKNLNYRPNRLEAECNAGNYTWTKRSKPGQENMKRTKNSTVV